MRPTDLNPAGPARRLITGGIVAAILLLISLLGASTAMAQTSGDGVTTPTPVEFGPNEVRGNPWICIDRGYQYGFTIAQNIPNSQENNTVVTAVVNNGSNVLGKDTPEMPNDTISVTSVDGVNFSWLATFSIKAVIVKGSSTYNQYTYALPNEVGGVTGDDGPLTTPQQNNGNFPRINQVTFCWGDPAPPPPPLGSLTVTKTVTGAPPGDTHEFTFNLAEDDNVDPLLWTNFNFLLTDGQTSQTYAIAANTDNVLQEVLSAMPDGYAFDSLACTLYASFEDYQLSANPIADPGGAIIIAANVATLNVETGQHVDCTYTNIKLPQLTVIKTVVNDNGGTLGPEAFTMNVTGTNVSTPSFPGAASPGTTVTLNAGAYSVDETDVAGYAKTLSADCAGTIAIGESKTCTITNDDIASQITGPPVTPIAPVLRPRLAIVKTGPLRARGLDRITYTIRVRNPGKAVARNVVVTDVLPSGLTFIKASRTARVKGRTIIIRMGNLRPGQARTVKVTVRAAANIRGRKINLAVARATNVRPVRDTAPTVFRPLVRRVVPAVTG